MCIINNKKRNNMKHLQTGITIFTTLIITLITLNVWGANTTDTTMAEAPLYFRGNKVYNAQGMKVSNTMVTKALENTTAAALWQQGCKQQRIGIGMIAVAGTLTAGGLISYGVGLGGLDGTPAWAGIGLIISSVPFYVCSLIFHLQSEKNKQAAIADYNGQNATSCVIGISPMGMQLNVKF